MDSRHGAVDLHGRPPRPCAAPQSVKLTSGELRSAYYVGRVMKLAELRSAYYIGRT